MTASYAFDGLPTSTTTGRYVLLPAVVLRLDTSSQGLVHVDETLPGWSQHAAEHRHENAAEGFALDEPGARF
jgi:hypothetical protein